MGMPFLKQKIWPFFNQKKLERRFRATTLQNSASFRQESLIFLFFLAFYHCLISQTLNKLCKLVFLAFFIATVIWTQNRREFPENWILKIGMAGISLVVGSEFWEEGSDVSLNVWLFLMTAFHDHSVKTLILHSLLSYFFGSYQSLKPLDFLSPSLLISLTLMFLLEKQQRQNFLSHEKTMNNLKSRAQLIDYHPSPVFVVSRASEILFANKSATDLKANPGRQRNLLAWIHEEDREIYDTVKWEVLLDGSEQIRRIRSLNNEFYEVRFQRIIWEKTPAVLLIFNRNKAIESMLISFGQINKTLHKMASHLLENMETDYNKWSNLQTLKYIKQSDMKLLANCVMQSNYLKTLIHANLDKTRILLTSQKSVKPQKRIIFQLKNTIILILEIISVQTIPKHQEIRLKFDDSFPEKVLGDLQRLKQSFLIIWRQISLIFPENSEFQLLCKLKCIAKNNKFLIEFKFLLPENPTFFALLSKVTEDSCSLSHNIYHYVYETFDLLMFKPIISLLGAEIRCEAAQMTFYLDVPFEPYSELEAKTEIINSKTPFLLTFCRTNPDKNSYRWKEIQFQNILEKEKCRVLPSKSKKIAINKELPKPSAHSSEETEHSALLLLSSSKEISEKCSSKEESPELEPRNRKKTHSCFSKEVMGKELGSAGISESRKKAFEEMKNESITDFMTPNHKYFSNDCFIKAIIQEDLKDVDQTIKTPRISRQLFDDPSQNNAKKQGFDRSIYEALFHSWKANEKTFKRLLISSVHAILERQPNLKLVFSKNKDRENVKRQNSMPLFKSSSNLRDQGKHLSKINAQTPQWIARSFKKRKTIKTEILETSMNRIEYEQENMAFLGSRMVLSPRATFFKKDSQKSSGKHSRKPLRKELSEFLKQRNYTVRRRWVLQD